MSIEKSVAALAASTEPISLPLGDKTIRISPPREWRQSVMRALQAGNYDTWVTKAAVNDLVTDEDGNTTGSDDGQVWVDYDPTNEEVGAFVLAYTEAGGFSLGK